MIDGVYGNPEELVDALWAAGEPFHITTPGWVDHESAAAIFGRINRRYPTRSIWLKALANQYEGGFVPDGAELGGH